jgi:hypothetical protein
MPFPCRCCGAPSPRLLCPVHERIRDDVSRIVARVYPPDRPAPRRPARPPRPALAFGSDDT